MKHFKNFAFYAVGILALCWIIGFAVFCYYAVTLKYAPDVPVRAVVVLTGGADRIATGLEQMREKKLDALLISGVNRVVSRSDIVRHLTPEEEGKITLGYWAENTVQNAVEVGDWALSHRYDSILLVTSFYHMPRARFEILKNNPDLVIVPYPVFPRTFDNSVEWVRTKYAWFLFLEYNKFITVHAIYWLRRMI